MSERITEAELMDEELLAGDPVEGDAFRRRIVAEVRRLRGLIEESAETIRLALTCADAPRDVSGQALHEHAIALADALLVEARAIQGERA